ncbi:MAG TPA: hypothetical protein VK558_16145 [Patescibacteria group bacterium]|nr:hypothetical protein [Patescibacteria group bacterium]
MATIAHEVVASAMTLVGASKLTATRAIEAGILTLSSPWAMG